MSIYLDYNATTPVDSRVLDTMIDVYRNNPGNADSRTHDFGEDARKIVENARKQVADLLNINVSEVFLLAVQPKAIILQFWGCVNMQKLRGRSI